MTSPTGRLAAPLGAIGLFWRRIGEPRLPGLAAKLTAIRGIWGSVAANRGQSPALPLWSACAEQVRCLHLHHLQAHLRPYAKPHDFPPHRVLTGIQLFTFGLTPWAVYLKPSLLVHEPPCSERTAPSSAVKCGACDSSSGNSNQHTSPHSLCLPEGSMSDNDTCWAPSHGELGSSPTCAGLLLVHIDHALLLALVAVRALLLTLPVEGWPRVAAMLCASAMLDYHHALLRTLDLPAKQNERRGTPPSVLRVAEDLRYWRNRGRDGVITYQLVPTALLATGFSWHVEWEA